MNAAQAKTAKIRKLEKVGERVYMSPLGGSIVQFTSSKRKNFQTGSINKVVKGGISANIMFQGKSNTLPQEREKLIQRNAYLPNLHLVQRNLLLGDEFIAYKKIRENGKTRIEEVDFPKQLTDKFPIEVIRSINEAIANDYVKHSQAFVQFVWKKDNTIADIKVQQTVDMRAEEQDEKGIIRNWLYSNAWACKPENLNKEVMVKIPAIDYSIIRNPKNNSKWKQKSFVLPIQDMLHNDGYYAIPSVDGIRDPVELSNCVWLYHDANLKNGYNLRWHVEIPEDYFFDYKAVEDGTLTEEKALEEAKDKEQDFIDKMNGFLAGLENAGRAIYTKKLIRNIEKDYPGIVIKALEYDMKDEALLKLEQRAMVATLSNQGVPPILASVQLPEGFGSGSQVRNVLYMYQIIQLPFMRQKIYSWLDVLKYTEGLPSDIYYGAKDREITTLDVNPTGQQKTNVSN